MNGKVWEVIWKVVTILIMPWAMWMSLQVIEMQTAVAVINSNRFTSADGQDVWKALSERPTRIEVESKYPPRWLLDRVEHIEAWQQRHMEWATEQVQGDLDDGP